MQTCVAKIRNFLFASVRAAVADDPRFEIREILSQKTLQSVTQHRAAIVSRRDDAHGWCVGIHCSNASNIKVQNLKFFRHLPPSLVVSTLKRDGSTISNTR